MDSLWMRTQYWYRIDPDRLICWWKWVKMEGFSTCHLFVSYALDRLNICNSLIPLIFFSCLFQVKKSHVLSTNVNNNAAHCSGLFSKPQTSATVLCKGTRDHSFQMIWLFSLHRQSEKDSIKKRANFQTFWVGCAAPYGFLCRLQTLSKHNSKIFNLWQLFDKSQLLISDALIWMSMNLNHVEDISSATVSPGVQPLSCFLNSYVSIKHNVLFLCVCWCNLHRCHHDRRDSPFFHCENTLAHRWLSPPLWQVGRVGDKWGWWGLGLLQMAQRASPITNKHTDKKNTRKKGGSKTQAGMQGKDTRGWMSAWMEGVGRWVRSGGRGLCCTLHTCKFWHWCSVAHKALAPLPTLCHTARHGGACQRGLAAQNSWSWLWRHLGWRLWLLF